MKEFAERLKQIQKQKGITQKELALRLGLSQATMSAYIRDAKTPALDLACDIAKKLNVSIGWLCGEPEASDALLTYADLLRVLVKTADSTQVDFHVINAADRDENPYAKTCSGLITSDSVIRSFCGDWCRVRDLFERGTIDGEMYDAWIEKRIRDYENTALPDEIELPF